jgi:hypothetical protein
VNIDAAVQLAFIVQDALGDDHLPATKTYRVEDVVDELVRKFNVEISLRIALVRATDFNTRYASTTHIPTTERFTLSPSQRLLLLAQLQFVLMTAVIPVNHSTFAVAYRGSLRQWNG